MRIGIFGGTFDPVHLGHLILAEQAREQARLDQVWFIPSARPPHKLGRMTTPFHHRAEMLAIAVAGHPSFRVEELEKDRPGPSFTADTLDEIQRDHPDAELFLLVGADSLADLPLWHDPERILRRATLAVMGRPGAVVLSAGELASRLGLLDPAAVRLLTINAPLIDISSTDLRSRVAEGRSIRYMVPRGVEAYIQDKGLYQREANEKRQAP